MSLWLTETYADTYFDTRLGAGDNWASGTDKTSALTTAQADIENCNVWEFDDPASGEDYDDAQKQAVCEQALFLLQQDDALDKRMGLQAQGVMDAGVINERYRLTGSAAIAPRAVSLLRGYAVMGTTSQFGLDR